MNKNMKEEFLHPSEEFSVIPFWFWNDELSEEEIASQMRQFKEKGIDGFVIHPRLGLPESIGYLSETYFHYVTYAVEYARQLNMHVVLYDEAMYPSGSAHGMVVQRHPEYASKGLLRTQSKEEAEQNFIIAGKQMQGNIIAANEEEGETWYYAMVPSKGTIRGVYYGEDDGESNAPWSADLLSEAAVRSFLTITYEAYYQHLKDYFGSTVWAMFTDEPNILGRCAREDLIPWSEGILEELEKNGGKKENLKYLFSSQTTDSKESDAHNTKMPSEAEKQLDAYKKTIHDRMSKSYYQQIGNWCRAHGVGLTGHPEKSTDIGYLQYFDIPSQDIVWRFVAPEDEKYITGEHSTMGKCSADSARHRGKRKNGNECFGCCGAVEDPYRFTREDMLWYCNWLFVRGVNVIYPHAFYYSVRGRRKEERPPEVGMHSAFWSEYKPLADYCKRMCGLLTDAVNQTEIAVLCTKDELSWQIARPLFEHQIEFNYLEEELLSSCKLDQNALKIQKQAYRIIICNRAGYEKETEEVLKQYQENGIIILSYDNDQDLLDRLDKVHENDVVLAHFEKDLRCTHLKKEGQDMFIITNEGVSTIQNIFQIRNRQIKEVWNAMDGTITEVNRKCYDLSLLPSTSMILILQ